MKPTMFQEEQSLQTRVELHKKFYFEIWGIPLNSLAYVALLQIYKKVRK